MADYLVPGGAKARAVRPDLERGTGIDLAALANGTVIVAATYALDVEEEPGRSFVGYEIRDGDGALVAGPVEIASAEGRVPNPFSSTDFERIDNPSVFVQSDGSAIVTWTQRTGDDFAVMAQRVTQSGSLRGESFVLDVPRAQEFVPLESGGFLVAWTQEDFANTENSGLFVQRFRADGQALGAPEKIDIEILPQSVPSTAPGPNGGTLLTVDTFFSRTLFFDAEGTFTGDQFVVTEDPPGVEFSFQTGAQVVALTPDRLLAVWSGTSNTGSDDILARTFDADGSNPSRIYRLNQFTDGNQISPQIALRPDGGAVVVWRDVSGRGDDDSDIYARRLNENGRPQGPEVAVSFDESTNEFDIAVAAAGDGDLLVGFEQAGLVRGAFVQPLVTGASGDATEGTRRADTLQGTPGADIATGLAGNDRLTGKGGDDGLFGDAGADTLIGGPGEDTLRGDTGNDVLKGQAGDDVLVGAEGVDRAIGGGGADTLEGGDGNDILKGGGGNDQIAGDADNDRLFGGGGDDRIEGDEGNDQLYGGAGNDLMFGGNGDDLMIGGGGDDRFAASRGEDRARGNAGADTFTFNLFNESFTVLDFDPTEDVLELQTSFWPELRDLSAETIVDDFAEVVDGNTVFELGSGPGDTVLRLVLIGITDLDAVVGAIDTV